MLSPVVLPIYTPEIEFGLALGAMATFSAQPQREEVPRSTIGIVAVPSTNGSLNFNGEFESFMAGDRVRIQLDMDYDDGPENYWGVGYEAGREIEEDEDVTEFQRVVLDLPLILNFRIGRSMFVGLNLDYIDMDVEERSLTQEMDPNFLAFGDKITSVGAGAQFTFDSPRRHPQRLLRALLQPDVDLVPRQPRERSGVRDLHGRLPAVPSDQARGTDHRLAGGGTARRGRRGAVDPTVDRGRPRATCGATREGASAIWRRPGEWSNTVT